MRRPLVSYATIDQTIFNLDSSERSPSVDRIRKRPPLQHAACFDQSDVYDFHFNGRSKSVVQFRSRSTSLDRRNNDDETPETPSFGKSEESEDHATVKSGTSFDLDAFYPEVFTKKSETDSSDYPSFGEKLESTYERTSKNRTNEYFYDKVASTDDELYFNKSDDTFFNNSIADINDPLQIQRMSVTALFEKFCADESEVNRKPQPIRQASETCFRTTRLRGISSDRLGGMFIKKTRTDRKSSSSLGDQPGSGSCFSIFEKKKGKLTKLEKSKRLSTSALYDQSPTGNQTKPNRIRSQEERLSKVFNSDEIPVPSTSKSEIFRYRFDENPLERASVAKLYEKFVNDTPPKPASLDNSLYSSRIMEEQPLSDGSSPKVPFSAASLSEKTSDIMSSTIKPTENVFNFNLEEANFTKEEVSEVGCSEASNTLQLIFEDPRSNRTSVSDIYEPCFSLSLTPRQPSFKRGSLKNNWMELTSSNFKLIDDDSPTSKMTSSPDTDLNTDVFMSPDYQFSFSVNGDTLATLADPQEDSLEENSISEYSNLKTKLASSKSVSSRSSMQKLQPIVFNNLNNGSDICNRDSSSIELVDLNNFKKSKKLNDGDSLKDVNSRVSKDNLLNNKSSINLNSKKNCNTNKDFDLVQKRTRCFPL